MPFLRAIFQRLACLLTKRECEQQLDDEMFYHTYYGDSPVPKDIPIRVRKVLVEQLGSRWMCVKPQDRPTDEDTELDLAELVYEIEDEFRILISKADMQQLDGSFDAIVQYLAR